MSQNLGKTAMPHKFFWLALLCLHRQFATCGSVRSNEKACPLKMSICFETLRHKYSSLFLVYVVFQEIEIKVQTKSTCFLSRTSIQKSRTTENHIQPPYPDIIFEIVEYLFLFTYFVFIFILLTRRKPRRR